MAPETIEAMYAFGACLALSGGAAIWVGVIYFVPAIWKRLKRIDKVLDFEEKQKYYER